MLFPQVLRFAGLLVLLLPSVRAAEQDALDIDAIIQARHNPYGTILNPIFSTDGSRIVNYTRCGDSAIWTGHYLAAEAYRFAVTGSPQALTNLRGAVDGLTLMVDVTKTGLLARCAFPADSPYGMRSEEAANGVYQVTLNGNAWQWVGNTSRDQYSGVFFGLGTAYDLVPDPNVRAAISALVTRMLNNLLQYSWNVVMPDGSVATTFILRPDQQLTLLQIGAHVNPQMFASEYSQLAGRIAPLAPVPLALDSMDDHNSYFKFNLAFINLFSLIRLEADSGTKAWYEQGFSAVRTATDNHLNAHFNMIDRALHGPDRVRDAETRQDLEAWLQRPRKDVFVDWRGKIPACGNADTACHPIPVEDRPPSDFVWQLSPFQLDGGGSGIIETAGIDYILPYWMARYYGVVREPWVPPHRGRR